MDDVQRFAVRKDALIRESEEFPPAFPHGYLEFVVLAADAAAHEAAAVAAARAEELEGERRIFGYYNGYEQGQRDERARRNRVLTADDPEPAVGSVVLDSWTRAWQRIKYEGDSGWVLAHDPNVDSDADAMNWSMLAQVYAPLRLIFDLSVIDAAPQDGE